MKTGLLIAAFFLTTGSTLALAEEAKPTDKKAVMEFSKEEREQMATHHEKMAACLRSEKSIQSCREEMREACRSQMGKDTCPMMGEMGGKRWMRRGAPKSN